MPACEIEVDGKWYVPVLGQLVAGATTVRQGDTCERFAAISLEGSRWVLKSAVKTEGKTAREVAGEVLRAAGDLKNRLGLAPGKQTVRVMCEGIAPLLPGGDQAGPKLHPVSNSVEITISKP